MTRADRCALRNRLQPPGVRRASAARPLMRWAIALCMGLLAPATVSRAVAEESTIRISIAPVASAVAKPEDRVKKVLEVPKTATPPVLDGRLDDACWKDAATADHFVQLGSDLPAKEQTVARLTYDDRALYLGFLCRESNMGQVLAQKTKHDDGVWQDDCIEIFLDPRHDHRTYCQFIVNSIATRQEARMGDGARLDSKWDGEWEAKAARDESQWTVEVAIPFASVEAKPGIWGINLCREECPTGELSCWAKQMKRFASVPEELALFGDLVFDNMPVKARSLSTGNPGWGRNLMKVEIENRTDKEAQWQVVAAVIPPEGPPTEAASSMCRIAPKAAQAVEFPYEITRLLPGKWRIAVSVRDASSGQVWAVGEFPFEVKDPSPFCIAGRVIVGPEYIVPARLKPVIGALTWKEAICRVGVTSAAGQAVAQQDLDLAAALPAQQEAEVRMDLSGLAQGRYVIAAQVLDRAGKSVSDRTERTIIKIPGPFEEAAQGARNLVENPSFEAVNEKGDPAGWIGSWWAAKESGLSRVDPKEFLAVDDTTAKDGKRSMRIRSTRGGQVGSDEVLTFRSAAPIRITPGVAYELTCWWKSAGIVGIGKIWAQTPKRQFSFRGTINGTNPDWLPLKTTFTPDAGETSCHLNFSLHGKDGTLWVDQVTFGEQAASIQSLLPPNAWKPEGVCLLAGNVAGKDLKLRVEVADTQSGQTLSSASVPVEARTVRLALPGFTADRKCRLTAVLTGPDGKPLDTKTAPIFGAPTGD